MSVRRIHAKLRNQLIQYGAIATLGALALGAKGVGGSNPGPSAAPALNAPGFSRIPRGEHPLARPEFDIGRLEPSKRLENLSLVFKLSPEQRADRDALVEAVSNPSSPQYRQFLTPETYAARFGAKPEDIARAAAWLRSQGLQVSATSSRLGSRLIFGGTVANIESAFRTEMHQYKVGGEIHRAMSSAPALPAALADVVLAVHNTHDFYLRPLAHKMKPVSPETLCPTGKPLGVLCQSDAGVGQPPALAQGIAPPDWKAIYDLNPLYTTGIGGKMIDGTGVTIAIVGTSEVAASDLNTFWTTIGGLTSRAAITTTLVPNTGTLGNQGGSAIEAVLDTEWAGAIAPGATINYVVVGQNDQNVDDATFYAIEQNLGAVLSESWGGCEAGIPASDADILQVYGSAASLLGISYLASSGDDLATSCLAQGTSGLYVNIPAAYPGVTSVGGTGFQISPSALTFGAGGIATGYPAATGAEAVWNEGNDPNSMTAGFGGGGGGISVLFPRPSYQTQAAAPTCDITGSLPVTGITASAMRQVPDVAFTAAGGGVQTGIFIECTIDLTLGMIDPTTGMPGGDCAPKTEPMSPFVVVPIGGTSASTPAFAGVVALASQASGGRLGNINPLLYSLPANVFHDITAGDNKVVCQAGDTGCPTTAPLEYGFAAKAGFDCATGLGSVDGTKFVTQIASLTPTTTTLAAITSPLTEGTAVPLTANVAVTGTTNMTALAGNVTFTFQTYLANGNPDLTWTLSETAITGGTKTGGTATPSPAVAIPPGMMNSGKGVDVIAEYGGDATHLPSVSPKVHVTFAPAATTFCVTPSTTTTTLGGTVNFTAAGGVAPIKWLTVNDSSGGPLDDGGFNGANLDEKTGVLTAGTGHAGYITVVAIDSDGAETFGEVTVGSPDGGAPPWEGDSGIVLACAPVVPDAGPDSGSIPDSGSLPDSSTNDLDSSANADTGPGSNGGSGGSSGCGCTTAGRSDTAPAGMLGGLVLGLGLIARRRRSRR